MRCNLHDMTVTTDLLTEAVHTDITSPSHLLQLLLLLVVVASSDPRVLRPLPRSCLASTTQVDVLCQL